MSVCLKKDHILQDSDLQLSFVDEDQGLCVARRWTVTNEGADAFEGTLRLEQQLGQWAADPWFMIPGVLYGSNDSASRGSWQPRGQHWPQYDPSAESPARMVSNAWDFAADRTASSLVYAYDDGHCFAFASYPHYEASDGCKIDEYEQQVGVGFKFDGSAGYMRISVPSCEEPYTYANSSQSAPTIRRITIPAGGSVSGTLYVFDFEGAKHDYQRVLEFYYETVGRDYPTAEIITDTPGLHSVIEDALYGILDHHYDEKQNYLIYSRPYDMVCEQFANELGTSFQWPEMNTGFVSGFPICWGLAIASRTLGDPRAQEVAVKVADKICSEGMSASGLFWGNFKPAKVNTDNGQFKNRISTTGEDTWGSGWISEPNAVHTRTIADACWSLAGLIGELPDHPSAELWKKSLASNINTILDLQLADGRYGTYYNAVEKTVVQPDGCGGLLWIPAMLLAMDIFSDDGEWVKRVEESIKRAAEGYSPAVMDEYIWGAPEDNNSASSEDGFIATMAYCGLYERFGDEQYLDLGRRSADWMLSFRKTFNGRLHPLTMIGAYDLRSKGGDFASASNNHLHSFEVLVTPELFKLSRWTGNDYYHKRARDQWAFIAQLLCRVDGQYNGFRGAVSEQFYWSNWSSWGQDTTDMEPDGIKGGCGWRPPSNHHQKGHFEGFSALWCINLMIVGARMFLDLQDEL